MLYMFHRAMASTDDTFVANVTRVNHRPTSLDERGHNNGKQTKRLTKNVMTVLSPCRGLCKEMSKWRGKERGAVPGSRDLTRPRHANQSRLTDPGRLTCTAINYGGLLRFCFDHCNTPLINGEIELKSPLLHGKSWHFQRSTISMPRKGNRIKSNQIVVSVQLIAPNATATAQATLNKRFFSSAQSGECLCARH